MIREDAHFLTSVQRYAELIYKVTNDIPEKDSITIKAAAARTSVAATVIVATSGNKARGVFRKRLCSNYEDSKRELRKLKRKHPDIDLSEIQQQIEYLDNIIN